MKTTLARLTRAWTSSQDVPGNSAVTYYQLQQVLLLSAPLRFLQYMSSSAVFTSTAPSSKFCNGPTGLLVWVPSPLHHSEDHLFKVCNGSKIAATIFLLRGGTTWTGTDPELQVWICWHRFLRDSAPHFFHWINKGNKYSNYSTSPLGYKTPQSIRATRTSQFSLFLFFPLCLLWQCLTVLHSCVIWFSELLREICFKLHPKCCNAFVYDYRKSFLMLETARSIEKIILQSTFVCP